MRADSPQQRIEKLEDELFRANHQLDKFYSQHPRTVAELTRKAPTFHPAVTQKEVVKNVYDMSKMKTAF